MANKKINELTAETVLSDNNLLITQLDTGETKSATLSLLKQWLNGLTFDDIATYFAEGSNVTISVDTENEKITVTASAEKGEKGDDGVTPHIDETTKHWFVGETDTGVLAEGKDGKDGVTPTITVEQTDTGCMVTAVSGETTTTAELTNGITTIQTTSEIFTGSLLVDSWVGDTVPYTQTISMEDITANTMADFGIVLTQDNIETALNEKKQWGYITTINTIDGGIVFSCYEKKPTIQLNYKMRVV